jgi:hypothetical protein
MKWNLGFVAIGLVGVIKAQAPPAVNPRLIPPAYYAVVDAPFTAEIELTWDESEPNGKVIHHVRESRQLRDSAGNQRIEDGADKKDRGPGAQAATWIFNVAGRRSYRVDEKTHRVWFWDMPKARQQPLRVPASAVKPVAWQAFEAPASSIKEKLPDQEIAGLKATGTRTTKLIPAGSPGVKETVTVVEELWLSPLYRMPLMRVYDDPRTGRLVVKVLRLEPGEPDARLFKPPADYELIDGNVPKYAPEDTFPQTPY